MSLNRYEVRKVACPKCGAEAGRLCRRDRGGQRKSNHFERMQRAQRELERDDERLIDEGDIW